MVEVFFLLDRNKDGALIRDEIPGASEAAFRAADRSGDGRLTVPEYTDARMKDYEAADQNQEAGAGAMGGGRPNHSAAPGRLRSPRGGTAAVSPVRAACSDHRPGP